MIFDVAVIGLGGMGSATAAHAARRGASVAGIEQFGPAHALGASHGGTRLIRMAYFEGPQYVPLLRRAYELWDELEAQTGSVLRSRTGGIFVGEPSTNLIAGTLASARAYEIPVDLLDEKELRRRHPLLRARPAEVGVFEPSAGVVFPEAAVRAHLEVARAHGAELRFETTALRWERNAGSFRVALHDGGEVRAHKLALCVGPWFAQLLRALRLPVKVERNLQLWFDPQVSADFTPEHFCAFALERDGMFFYGFPDYGDGIKCAFHHTQNFTTAQALDRRISGQEIEAHRVQLDSFAPGAAGKYRNGSACMYALTPDEQFIIGSHLGEDDVFIAGGFSGHGFKFCPVIGEIMADYIIDGTTRHAIEQFAPQRFGSVLE